MSTTRSLGELVQYLEAECERLRTENRELHAELQASIGAPTGRPDWYENSRLRAILDAHRIDPLTGETRPLTWQQIEQDDQQ